jgi:phage tail-like protein
MDANQQRFWMLADPGDWPGIEKHEVLEYDKKCRRLRLRDSRKPEAAPGDLIEDQAGSQLPAMARDALGTYAFWHSDNADGLPRAVMAQGNFSKPIPIYQPAPTISLADMAFGYDDVLYLALYSTAPGNPSRAWVGMLDTRSRWTRPRVYECELKDFRPDRLCADRSGGVWALNRLKKQVARLQGMPLPDGQPGEFAPPVFRPKPESPAPELKLDIRQPELAHDDVAVALACSPAGRVAVLVVNGDQSILHVRELDGRWGKPRVLNFVGRCISIAWLSESRLVVMPASRKVEEPARYPRNLVAYNPDDETDSLQPLSEIYPLRGARMEPFVNGVTLPPHYRTGDAASRPIAALSAIRYSESGETTARILDGGEDGFQWHRIYLEGVLPAHTGIIVSLAASDDLQNFKDETADWYDHFFGDVTPADSTYPSPRGAWVKDRSELPHHAGLLGAKPERGRVGLFTALVQRTGRRVRALKGRYLHVRFRLSAGGNSTPELAALRIYGARFSYRDQYLPELYREDLFGGDANRKGSATPSDFLERFLCLFESVLTPLEDRVAAAHILMDARSAPDEALEWLGSWVGVAFEPSFPQARRRAWVAASHRIHKAHGTLAGLQLALEIISGGSLVREMVDGRETEFPRGGGVTGGRILVIEEYRLRRTFATILGANLNVSDDPLLPGLLFSTQSFVGDTLMLGDEEKKEFLALFRDAFSSDPATRAAEQSAVYDFYARQAHRVTVLVQDTATSTEVGLIRRIAALEAPAHVLVSVVPVSRKLIVGLFSLIAVDTYLAPPVIPGVARLDSSYLGEGDFIRNLPALAGGNVPPADPPPVAVIKGSEKAELGDSIPLSGADSKAAPRRELEQFIWTQQTPNQ